MLEILQYYTSGFLTQFEKLEDGAIRELKDKTKIKVSKNMLKGSIKDKEVFDNPYRSLRGRTITHAYHFILNLDYLPSINNITNTNVMWYPIHDLMEISPNIFEDHADIISHFTGINKSSKVY